MLSLVNPKMLEQEVLNAENPVLMAFLRKDKTFFEQIKMLETISKTCGDCVKVCLGDEYFLDMFFQQFGFSGTPFYLLLFNGKEQGRFFGRAAMDDLEDLLRDCGVTSMDNKSCMILRGGDAWRVLDK